MNVQNFRRIFTQVTKIYCFSDGAHQQFKNKKAFANLCYRDDFDVYAEWYFFATAHGKGPCDRLAGTIKRLARRASLQIGTRQLILTPLAIFEWALESLPKIDFVFLDNNDYERVKGVLEQRFVRAVTVHGTLMVHAAKPIENRSGCLIVKPVAKSTEESVLKALK